MSATLESRTALWLLGLFSIASGILLSTGTTGSEGTLGSLVEEGRRLRHH